MVGLNACLDLGRKQRRGKNEALAVIGPAKDEQSVITGRTCARGIPDGEEDGSRGQQSGGGGIRLNEIGSGKAGEALRSRFLRRASLDGLLDANAGFFGKSLRGKAEDKRCF